jgi:mRNA interferase MazF
MFNLKKNTSTTINMGKDFKKLATLVKKAIGCNTIPEFANHCGIPNSAKRIADITHERISTYPEVELLRKIANGSEFRVTFDELRIACGYSLNDSGVDLRSVSVMRGWICLCDYGNVIDSEQGGIRPSLIIANNVGNLHAGITMVIPISSRIGKNNMPTHIRIGQDAGLTYESELLIEQMTRVSKRRLMVDGFIQILCECPEDILRKVEIAIMKQTGIVTTRANENVVDRFLDKLTEYTQKAEQSYNNRYQNNNQEVKHQRAIAFA